MSDNVSAASISGGDDVKPAKKKVKAEKAKTREMSAGETRELELVSGVAMELVWIPPGCFQMGADDAEAENVEKPVHQVTLTKGYWIGKYEVTQKEWKGVMGTNPSRVQCGDHFPVERVSWDDCQEFVRKVNENLTRSGKSIRVRLPSEAEWEFAARGGVKSRGYVFSGDEEPDDVAWYGGDGCDETHKVGTKAANELGLYDMSGNVWEWCQDWFGDYPGDAVSNPAGPASGDGRVIRGGCWSSLEYNCRVTHRTSFAPSQGFSLIGFRLAADGTDELETKTDKKATLKAKKAKCESAEDALSGVQLWEDGPYWAECNVGATKPEEAGLYFWWGDTVGYKPEEREGGNEDEVNWMSAVGAKGNFSFEDENCPTFDPDNFSSVADDCIGATGNLVPEHDAATAHLGAPWRMPSKVEWQTLLDKCDSKWTKRHGVSGRLVTGRGAYASRSIFLPAVGYGCDSIFSAAGESGRYWSSTPKLNSRCNSQYVNFDSDVFWRDYIERFWGLPVRPLRGGT